jgi:ubiquinone/menaquinone biosynthesis C-methylase UbiE
MTKLKDAYERLYVDNPMNDAWDTMCGRYKAENVHTVLGHYIEPAASSLLECGSGNGGVLQWFGKFRSVYALDLSEAALNLLRGRNIPNLVEARAFDGYTIPYPDKSFDVAACLHVLEHVEHPRIVLRELKRVSTYQVLEIPLDYSVGVDSNVDYFLGYGHINIFTPTTFRFLLKTEGFEILQERFSESSKEVLRFDLYENRKVKKTLLTELRMTLSPLKAAITRLILGRKRSEEFTYKAMTVLVRGDGELNIHG